MIYLILLLTLTHFIVLYKLKKYLEAYKKNNYNYITGELQKINQYFEKGITDINQNINILSQNTNQTFKNLKNITTTFTKNYKQNFLELINFIKSDYHSLTVLVKDNNDLLENLLKRTEENITKNQDLKPLLINSHEELEKIYGKIKLLISGYEKNLNSISEEMEDTITTLENTMNTKIKLLTAKGEKTILESLEISKNTIHTITDETNSKLKTILRDNQLQLLTDNIQSIDQELKTNISTINTSIENLDEIFIEKLKAYQEANKDKKGFFGF